MPVTLKDIARRANVNYTLVSKFINKVPIPIRPATRQRIEEAIEELHYRPNVTARALRFGRTNTIGLVVGNLTNEYFAHFVDSAIIEAEKHGFHILISVCREISPEKAIQDLSANQVDGIICCDCFRPQGKYDLPIFSERSFAMGSMKKAMAEAVHFLRKRRCKTLVGLYTDDRWPEIFTCDQENLKIESLFLPFPPEEREAFIGKICERRPDAFFSTGWQTAKMISDILDNSFPGYHPIILSWANCRGPFFRNPRIQGAIVTSTIQSIKETVGSLAGFIKSDGEFKRPAPVTGCFVSRQDARFHDLERDSFALT